MTTFAELGLVFGHSARAPWQNRIQVRYPESRNQHYYYKQRDRFKCTNKSIMATNHSKLPILWRSEADPAVYELARVGRVFNHRRPKRYPIAVVEATEESHVIDAVRLAIERGCRVSVRSGGHSWAAWSVRDEAILIDLGKYHLINLDESRRTASVSPSTMGRMLNGFLDGKGLIFAGGHCPDVGLGG